MDKYQMLVKSDRVGGIVEDWVSNGTANITLRKAKTKGFRVVETTDAVYAARIVSWLQAAVKVNIVKQ